MGGDPVVTEPAVLKMDDKVKELFDKAGLLDFFRKFSSFSNSLSLQVVESWDEGRVKVDDLVFTISEQRITEVSSLPADGEVICHEKTNQVEQLSKFIRNDETFCWLQSGIPRESLLAPWDRVVVQVMKYLTLEGKFRKFFGYHIAILNSIRNRVKINVPLFLLKSLEKPIKTVKSGKGKLPLHQGLLKMLVNYEKARINSAPLILKGNLIRTSGTPVSKAQLLLGPASSIPKTSVDSSDSEEEEDSPSEDDGISTRKKGDSRKRKVAPQVLAASLAKCSRRSSRLQKKSANKVKIINYADSTEDEKLEKQDDNTADSERVGKDLESAEEIKDSSKIPPDNQNVLKELKSHLKVLNGLGGSLTGICACINLLTLEIANYLKEVVSRLKELNSGRS